MYEETYPLSTLNPSTIFNLVWLVLDSPMVITPSFPTLSIALKSSSPMSFSPAEIVAISRILSFDSTF